MNFPDAVRDVVSHFVRAMDGMDIYSNNKEITKVIHDKSKSEF